MVIIMRCHICNATLGDSEVRFNKDHDDWEPCGTCLTIIAEVFEDPLDEEEVDFALDDEFADDYSDLENSP